MEWCKKCNPTVTGPSDSWIARAAAAACAVWVVAAPAAAQSDVRSIDGSGNNVAHPDWGRAGVRLLRSAPAAYSDGIAGLAGPNRPSPRVISNAVADQGEEGDVSDRLLSAMIYAWGQFIDHDLDLTPTGGTELLTIPVPPGDPAFDPNGTGTQVITTTRSIFDPNTGTSTSNPRQQVNVVTAWLDGSMIYGSDAVTANKLRAPSGGRLKTSPGDLLPFNSLDYFPDGPLPMANDAHIVPDDQLFAAGDVRANENVELTALHTLFVREHNYQAGRIASANPALTHEQVYQRARALVIAEIQSITYNQWLPAVLGRNGMPDYAGYNAQHNPGLKTEFTTAAFRFGHSLLGDDVEFFDDDGNPVGPEVPLSQAFFYPPLVVEFGIDPLLKYLASDPASELDTQIVNSVRNFLFGPPGAGGLDLASLNIARGRDHGLPDYNAVRQAYGLPRARHFAAISPDPLIRAQLQALYGSVNNIDLWVGALAEGHLQGASVGPTLRAIIAEQFSRLRSGDRFWYERVYGGDERRRIERTTLADVIRRNTVLTNLQQDVFFFKAGVSGTAFVDTNGDGRPGRHEPRLPRHAVELINVEEGELAAEGTTDDHGGHAFDVIDGLRTGEYIVQVRNAGGEVIGVSDTIAITRGGQFLDRVHIAVTPP